MPGNREVSEKDWAGFLEEVVTPAFPQGLTVWSATGQWLNDQGQIEREQTFVLEIIHSVDQNSDARIRAIAAEYRRRFHQESVLRVTIPANAIFY